MSGVPGRSRKQLTRVTVSVGGGTPVEAGRKQVEAAFRSLSSRPRRSANLKRVSGEMTFTCSNGKYEVVCERVCGTFYLPYPVTLDQVLSIARFFAKLDMLHEGHTWREGECP